MTDHFGFVPIIDVPEDTPAIYHPEECRRIRGVLVCGSMADICRLDLERWPHMKFLKEQIVGWEEVKKRLMSDETPEAEIERILGLVL